MVRTHNCGELNLNNISDTVLMSGWVHKSRDLGGMTFIDLRDRHGITQLAFSLEKNKKLYNKAKKLGREYVVTVEGTVIERSSKNNRISTGEIEVEVQELTILNKSKTPPFTIEDQTDGGEEIRMKYRYLDIRRNPVKENLILRSKISEEARKYLTKNEFIEVETPYLIKSTPEGARDFIVPSRMNEGQFYALPQSPQTFKQLLMVGGIDKYFQIVKCFRDEDLRADRQPEFTQIDCEMSFVNQEQILNMFEGLIRHLLKEIKGVKINDFPRMTYDYAIKNYGSDKPDTRFDMKFIELNNLCKGNEFEIFDKAELIVAINAKNCAKFSRKEIDVLVEYVKSPDVGGQGLVFCKYNEDGTIKSSVDKFFDEEAKGKWVKKAGCKKGDLLLIMAGKKNATRKALSSLRLYLGDKLNLRDPKKFSPLWVLDFPLLEWDNETKRYYAMHHPFTAPKSKDIKNLETNPEAVRANAYDLVLNGNEIGGGSIRIHDKKLQKQMFKFLGFSDKEAKEQFGFLMDAFEYGAPPHGGIAFGFDRICSLLGGKESIRDFIAFPKNNSGRDVMIDSPSKVDKNQLTQLKIRIEK